MILSKEEVRGKFVELFIFIIDSFLHPVKNPTAKDLIDSKDRGIKRYHNDPKFHTTVRWIEARAMDIINPLYAELEAEKGCKCHAISGSPMPQDCPMCHLCQLESKLEKAESDLAELREENKRLMGCSQIVQATKEVCQELIDMPEDEFLEHMRLHKHGDILKILFLEWEQE